MYKTTPFMGGIFKFDDFRRVFGIESFSLKGTQRNSGIAKEN